MNHPFRHSVFRSGLVVLVLLPLFTLNAAEDNWSASRTEFDHPNLQGNWTNTTLTPLLRPTDLGTKKTYTTAEALQIEIDAHEEYDKNAAPIDPNRPAPKIVDYVGTEETEFIFIGSHTRVARVNGEYRTSLVVDPPNGRIPYVENVQDNDIREQWRANGLGDFDGPEIRPSSERCLSENAHMPPMWVVPASTNFQIVQTENYVMLYGEPSSEARIIRLNGTHQSHNPRKWRGDSIGHWDNGTLIVHTINFHPQQSMEAFRSSKFFEVVERYTLVSEDEIYYSFTITDPLMYTSSFTVENSLTRMPASDKLYEQACHEGNYSLPGILAGARRQESDALEVID